MKRKKILNILIDIFTIFIALILADKISALFNASFWLADFLIYLIIIAIITIIGKFLESFIRKHKNK